MDQTSAKAEIEIVAQAETFQEAMEKLNAAFEALSVLEKEGLIEVRSF